MKSRLLLATLTALWAATLAASPAHADEGWVINSFHSDITINPDSTLDFTEDIHVDFGSQQHHGIFRTIPYEYHYDASHDRIISFAFASVTDGVKPVPYTVGGSGADDVLRIGNANVLVSGKQRYVIKYRATGGMNAFADHDELYWNIDGGAWPVAKQSVTATVTMPAGSFQKATCFQGASGSTEPCTFTNTDSTASFNTTHQLASREQLTIVTALNKGAVAVPPPDLITPATPPTPADALQINPATVGVSGLILLAGIGLIVRFWLVHGRDRAYLSQYYLTNDPSDHPAPLFQRDPVVVEFTPPQNLRPAELGLILDESADTKDVTATIVDLAVRGVLTITEVQGEKDWQISWRANNVTDILPFERTLLDGLFAGREQVQLSTLKGTFHPTLESAENQMYSDAMARKLFTTRPDYLRGGRLALGFILIIAGFFVGKWLGAYGWTLVGVAIGLVGVILSATFRMMSVRTAAGRDLMQHTLGFRMYMNTAEKYRQQFAEKAEIFTQLLPYAIVFGCVSKWAKAFEGIDTSKTDGWYVGSRPFQAALIASSLQSMNSSISTAVASTPAGSGSSGFGGGGFSGGGGGGGGGGAW